LTNAIFTTDVTSLSVFLLFTQTVNNKFFQLAAIFSAAYPRFCFAAYSRLSRNFRSGGRLAKFLRLAVAAG